MHPALSIIFFTVTTGLGYGWVALAITLDLLDIAGWHDARAFAWTVAVALVVIAGGLLSSTLHLANRRNAWRAVMRVRTSWLSREAVLALVFFPVFIGYAACVYLEAGRAAALLGWLSAVLALATVFATGMIYACLRTIRQWNTPLVPANYLLMALALGGLALNAQRELAEPAGGSAVAVVVFGLLMLALAGKFAYWFRVGLPDATGIDAAIGFRLASVRLLDVGHTAGTFLTDEFGYRVSRPILVLLKVLALGVGLILPAVLVAQGAGAAKALLALAAGFAGALVERWLFFAEAQHVVRLYHGQRST
jgi:DMSO reductase anchor subunit